MRILFFNRYRGDHLYGVERWMLRCGHWLSLRGHQVDLVCYSGSAMHQAAAMFQLTLHPFTGNFAGGIGLVMHLRRVMTQHRIEVICVKTWKELYLATYASVGLAVTCFCRRGNNGDIRDCFQHRLAITVCRPVIIAPSLALAQEFSKVSWMRDHPVRVVPHGINMGDIRAVAPEQGLPPCRCRFVFVGRLCPAKGVDVLLRAWPHVLSRAPDSRLLIVGAMEETDYAAITRAKGMADSVDFVGYQENPLSWIAASQVMVLPSRREGGGLVALEAMALGLPVIGTDVGGIPEYVENLRTGMIVPVGDENALADAMSEMAASPQRVQAVGCVARERILNYFSMEASVIRMEDVLKTGKG